MTTNADTRMDTTGSPIDSRTAPTNRLTHTPGPWRINLHAAFADDGRPIVGVWIESGDFCSIANLMPRPEVQANANLFLASPDLLAAAVEAENWLNHHGGDPDDDPGLRRLLAMLRSAIAKAEGRS